jgi:type VI secretion system protein VasD
MSPACSKPPLPLAARRRLLSASASSLLVGGCSSIGSLLPDSMKKPPAKPDLPGAPDAPPQLASRSRDVEWSIVVAADINPDDRGRASPVAVRLYQLKSTEAFAKADFFALFDNDAATLGTDLVGREEMLLVPGATLRLRRSLAPEARFIAAFAGFRNFDRAAARATLEITGSAILRIRLQVTQLALRFDQP